MSHFSPEPEAACRAGLQHVLALVASRAPRDCEELGSLQARRMHLSTLAASARSQGDAARAAEMSARLAALDIEIGLALGSLAARNGEIARLRAALT